jgi:hypothetical protein
MIVTDNRVSKRVGFYVRTEEKRRKASMYMGGVSGRAHETH